MRGRSTFLWLTLAAIVGFGLFHVKYKVQALEEELSHVTAATLKEQQQIHVLKAEWSYLNQPSRLEELAGRHLDLAPVRTPQIGTIADLPLRAAPPAKLGPPTKAMPAVPTSRRPRASNLTPVGMTR
ncbi:MAG: hypothetical protein V3R55_00130 [Alphaproteobacteria bacterium]